MIKPGAHVPPMPLLRHSLAPHSQCPDLGEPREAFEVSGLLYILHIKREVDHKSFLVGERERKTQRSDNLRQLIGTTGGTKEKPLCKWEAIPP